MDQLERASPYKLAICGLITLFVGRPLIAYNRRSGNDHVLEAAVQQEREREDSNNSNGEANPMPLNSKDFNSLADLILGEIEHVDEACERSSAEFLQVLREHPFHCPKVNAHIIWRWTHLLGKLDSPDDMVEVLAKLRKVLEEPSPEYVAANEGPTHIDRNSLFGVFHRRVLLDCDSMGFLRLSSLYDQFSMWWRMAVPAKGVVSPAQGAQGTGVGVEVRVKMRGIDLSDSGGGGTGGGCGEDGITANGGGSASISKVENFRSSALVSKLSSENYNEIDEGKRQSDSAALDANDDGDSVLSPNTSRNGGAHGGEHSFDRSADMDMSMDIDTSMDNGDDGGGGDGASHGSAGTEDQHGHGVRIGTTDVSSSNDVSVDKSVLEDVSATIGDDTGFNRGSSGSSRYIPSLTSPPPVMTHRHQGQIDEEDDRHKSMLSPPADPLLSSVSRDRFMTIQTGARRSRGSGGGGGGGRNSSVDGLDDAGQLEGCRTNISIISATMRLEREKKKRNSRNRSLLDDSSILSRTSGGCGGSDLRNLRLLSNEGGGGGGGGGGVNRSASNPEGLSTHLKTPAYRQLDQRGGCEHGSGSSSDSGGGSGGGGGIGSTETSTVSSLSFLTSPVGTDPSISAGVISVSMDLVTPVLRAGRGDGEGGNGGASATVATSISTSTAKPTVSSPLVIDTPIRASGSPTTTHIGPHLGPGGSRLDASVLSARQVQLQLQRLVLAMEKGLKSRKEFSEIEDDITNMLDIHPDLPRAHFLRFVNCLYHREQQGAVDALHRYFDYPLRRGGPNSQETSSGGRIRISCLDILPSAVLNIAACHYRFGHRRLAMEAFDEAIRVAQQNNDDVNVAYALAWLHHLLADGGASAPQVSEVLRRAIMRAHDVGLDAVASIATLSLTKARMTESERAGPGGGSMGRQLQAFLSAADVGDGPTAIRLAMGYGEGGGEGRIGGMSGVTVMLGGLGGSAGKKEVRRAEMASEMASRRLLVEAAAIQEFGYPFQAMVGGRSVLEVYGEKAGDSSVECAVTGLVSAILRGYWHVQYEEDYDHPRENDDSARDGGGGGGGGSGGGGESGGGRCTYDYALGVMKRLKQMYPHPSSPIQAYTTAVLEHEWAINRGDLREAAKKCRKLTAISKANVYEQLWPYFQAETAIQRVKLLYALGRWSEALSVAAAAQEACDRRGVAPQYASLLILQARIHLQASPHRPARALPMVLCCLSVCEAFGLDTQHATATSVLACVRLGMGHAARAMVLIKACLPHLIEHGPLEEQGHAWLVLAKCHIMSCSFMKGVADGCDSSGDGAGAGADDDMSNRMGSAKRDSCKKRRRESKLRKGLYALESAAKAFSRCQYRPMLREVYYLTARVCNVLPGMQKERELAAGRFVRTQGVQ